MANNWQLAKLLESVDGWNHWREDNTVPSIDLSGAMLTGEKLNNVNFFNAILSSAYMSNAELRKADFSSAKLRKTNLSGADLRESNFRDAKLEEAYLDHADLRGVDLRNANLSQASLWEADFTGANLEGANLTGADLSLANFRGANLENADLTDARCGGTVFVEVDLSKLNGIETIRHIGPSTIDVDTLFRTAIYLPTVFLRGCGVPEELIKQLHSSMNKAIDYYSCFISYNHQDKNFARRLHDTLQGRGIRCWLDEKQLNPGESLYEGIAHGIRYWDKVILCASKHSLNSWWVNNELNNIFAKERQIQNDSPTKQTQWLVIPLDLDGYLHSKEYTGGKKEQLRERLSADFTGWEHDNAIFEREIERVIKALRTDGGKEPPPKSRL